MTDDFIPGRAVFTGRKMLIVILAFFGVIIAANATMLVLAVKNFGGLVVENSYVASQRFNDEVAAAKAQPIRQWLIEPSVAPNRIEFSVSTAKGDAVVGKKLRAIAGRPTHERETVAITLAEESPGLYRASPGLAGGRWIVTLMTDDDQARSIELFVKASGP